VPSASTTSRIATTPRVLETPGSEIAGSGTRGSFGRCEMTDLPALRVATAALVPACWASDATAWPPEPVEGGATSAARNGSASSVGALVQAKRADAAFGAFAPTATCVVPITLRPLGRTATTTIR
jgi:hypothetical protein